MLKGKRSYRPPFDLFPRCDCYPPVPNSLQTSGSSTTAIGYRPNALKRHIGEVDPEAEVELNRTGNVAMEHPSSHRPLGAKKQKLEKKIERNISKASANVDEMTETLRSSAISKKQTASISLQLKILQKMSLDPLDMNHRLNELMERAAVLGGFEAKKEQQRSVSEHPSTVQPCRDDSSSPHSALFGNTSSYQWDEPTPSRSQQGNSNALNTSSPRTLSLFTRQIIGEGDASRAQRAQPAASRGSLGCSQKNRQYSTVFHLSWTRDGGRVIRANNPDGEFIVCVKPNIVFCVG
ncbi:hypothetical protein FGB62_10g36 [Gracilaria domingensis]|nr:hypothetical protein FGB62_10g36 [Gracilaria domingensis]